MARRHLKAAEPPFLRGLTFVGTTQATWLVLSAVNGAEASQLRDSTGFAPASLRTHRPGEYVPGAARISHTGAILGALLTIGNEVVSGDIPNTNATWLAQRLESLGVRVVLAATVPDEIDPIARFVRRERGLVDRLIVTGGLGGTPDDITREALAAAFEVGQVEVPELAAELRKRFPRHPDYAARWALLPAGSRPLVNPRGGAPGFLIENVWVLPGLPSEMEAMFDHYVDELRGERTIAVWRRAFPTRESEIVHVLAGATVRWPQVRIGSYPRFTPDGPEVEIVLKSSDAGALADAAAWIEPAVEAASAP